MIILNKSYIIIDDAIVYGFFILKGVRKMDINGIGTDNAGQISMLMANSKIMGSVETAMLGKTLDQQQIQADGLKKMMELSVNPGLGANFDKMI